MLVGEKEGSLGTSEGASSLSLNDQSKEAARILAVEHVLGSIPSLVLL